MEADTPDRDVASPFFTQLPGQGPPSPHPPGRKSGASSLETWQVVWEGRAVDRSLQGFFRMIINEHNVT